MTIASAIDDLVNSWRDRVNPSSPATDFNEPSKVEIRLALLELKDALLNSQLSDEPLTFPNVAAAEAYHEGPDGPIPPFQMFRIAGTGDDEIDGYYIVNGSDTIVRVAPLNSFSLIIAEIAELAEVIDSLEGKIGFINLGTLGGTNTILTGTVVDLVSPYANGKVYQAIAPSGGANTGDVTININAAGATPLRDWRGNELVPGSIVNGAKLVVAGFGTHMRVLAGIGVPILKLQVDRIPIDLGDAVRTVEGDFDIYTVVSDEATALPFQNGKRYTVTLPSENTKPKPKLRIKRSNGDLVDQSEIRQGPGSWALKIGSLPAGKHDIAGAGVNVLTMNPLGRDNSSIDADAIALAVDGKLDASVFEQFVANEQAALARVDEVAADMDGAVATAKGGLYPERPGETGWASLSRTGTLDAVLTDLVPASWLVDDAKMGSSVEIRGASVPVGQASIVIRRPDPVKVDHGHVYDATAVFRRTVNSENPSDDIIRVLALYLAAGDKAVIGQAVIFESVTGTAQGVRSPSKRLAFDAGDDVDIVMPLEAAYLAILAEFYGSTPTTRLSVLEVSDRTFSGAGGGNVSGLTSRVSNLETVVYGFEAAVGDYAEAAAASASAAETAAGSAGSDATAAEAAVAAAEAARDDAVAAAGTGAVYDTKAELDASSALVGQVVSDGTNNGLWSRPDVGSPFVKRSDATIPALDSRTASIEGATDVGKPMGDYADGVTTPFFGPNGEYLGGIRHDGGLSVPSLSVGAPQAPAHPDDAPDTPWLLEFTDRDGAPYAWFSRTGKMLVVPYDEEDLGEIDLLGGPTRVELNEAGQILHQKNADGTEFVLLDPESIEHVASQLNVGKALIPAGPFVTEVETAPALRTTAPRSDEGFMETYRIRGDVDPPAVAVPAILPRAEGIDDNGQSNSDGGGANDHPVGKRAVSTSALRPLRAFMLNGSSSGGPSFGGSLTALSTSSITDLAQLHESEEKETPISGMAWWLTRKDEDEGRRPAPVIAAGNGIGGQKLLALSEPGIPWDNSKLVTDEAVKAAQRYGLDLWYPTTDLDQGEADRTSTALATYDGQLASYRSAREAMLRGKTLQPEPVFLNIRQLCAPPSWGFTAPYPNAWTGLCHSKAMRTLPRTLVSHCDYHFKGNDVDDEGHYGFVDVHRIPRGHALSGEYWAKTRWRVREMVKAAIARGDDPFALTPYDIRPCLWADVGAATRSGVDVFIPLVLPWDSTEVEIDTATLPVADGTGIVGGFTKSSGGGAVSSVTIDEPTPGTYRLHIVQSVAAGGVFRWAYDAIAGDIVDRSAAWTNIKAPSSEVSYVVDGLNLDNWLIIDQLTIA